EATKQMQERFDVRPRDENLGSSKFSGGNQQKLILARELDEILALADRVVVMNAGRITGELSIDECDERRLGLLMAAQEERAVA
ncbi:MAG: heme ABC transporter ATP-binding protein, partial [Roseateles sp.]